MIIIFHRNFEKDYRQLTKRAKEQFKHRLEILLRDEFDPTLNNHPLQGVYKGYRSINITGDIRAIYKGTENTAVFVAIGSHSKLYH